MLRINSKSEVKKLVGVRRERNSFFVSFSLDEGEKRLRSSIYPPLYLILLDYYSISLKISKNVQQQNLVGFLKVVWKKFKRRQRNSFIVVTEDVSISIGSEISLKEIVYLVVSYNINVFVYVTCACISTSRKKDSAREDVGDGEERREGGG